MRFSLTIQILLLAFVVSASGRGALAQDQKKPVRYHVEAQDGEIVERTPVRSSSPGTVEKASTASAGQGREEEIIMTEDFESGFPSGDWQAYALQNSTDAYWDDTAYRSGEGDRSAWSAAAGAAAESSGGMYPNDMNAWMIYGPFDLSDAADAELVFQFWNQSEAEYDYFSVFASTDGQQYYGTQFTGDQSTWQTHSFDLTNVYELGDLRGEQQVWIAFHFQSDVSNRFEGAYVDDITLRKEVQSGQPNLVAEAINVSTATWEVGEEVTVELTEKNDGTAEAGAHTSGLYLSADQSLDGTDTALGDLNFNAVTPGAEQTQSATVTVPDVMEGTYYVLAALDANDAVMEGDEANMFYRIDAIEVTDPSGVAEIGVSVGRLEAALAPSDRTAKTFTIENTGTAELDWRLSVDVGSSSPAPRRASAASFEGASRSSALPALLEQAEEKGSVPVIVGLQTSFRPEGQLSRSAAVHTQRQRIAARQQALLQDLSAHELRNVKRFNYIPYVAFRAGTEALRQLESRSDVTGVWEDRPVPPTLSESISVVGADSTWEKGYSGDGQAVATLDTGVDNDHPFLSSKVVAEACFSTNSSESESLCPNGQDAQTGVDAAAPCADNCDHGTHVAGIAAGKNNQFAGVARDADIIGVQVFSKFFDSNCQNAQTCVLTYGSDQIRALEHVYALRNTHNIAAVNMSLGGGEHDALCDGAPQKEIIDNLRSAGIATIVSSGNSGYTDALGSPACISSAISVGSTQDGSDGTFQDAVSGFSNSADFLDLLAPGQPIYSSLPDGEYGNLQGTSMAAPHVAGAWAVLKSKDPSASVDQVLEALRVTGVPITDGRNNITKPRIQIDDAADRLTSWLVASPGSGSVAPGESQTVTVTFEADNLDASAYTGALTITSNDADERQIEVPVELTVEESGDAPPAAPTGLQADSSEGLVTLNWTESGAADLAEYRLYRGTQPHPTSLLATVGDSATTYQDTEVTNGTTYHYRITARDTAGQESAYSDEITATPTTSTAREKPPSPAAFAVKSPYPNPAGHIATLRYDLPEPATVSVQVYDALGRCVLRHTFGQRPAHANGTLRLPVDKLSAGVYVYRVIAQSPQQRYAGTGRLSVMH